jgi:hypothetical protein
MMLKSADLEIRSVHHDFFLHEYASYEDYRTTQIFHNKRKLKNVWADERTLMLVIDRVSAEFGKERRLFGLCHGTRNGFEQNFIASRLDVDITGTDISETALQFSRSMQWDFHDRNESWVGRCDFIYTNSLDQSWQPRSALQTWLEQLHVGGLLFIEHSELHGPQGASDMDPFGVSPNYLPFTLAEWFGHGIATEVFQSIKTNKDLKVWVFVVKRLR